LYHQGGDGGHFRERLVMLTGPARELVREPGKVERYHPDIGQVIIGPRRSGTAIFKLAEKDLAKVERHYHLADGPHGRVAGRKADAVEFRADDGNRFTYRVWRDVANDLPLQTEILSRDGRVLETFMFAEVTTGQRPKPGNLSFSVPKGVHRLQRSKLTKGTLPGFMAHMKLPPGYRLDDRFGVPGEQGGTHYFYTDGLATLSVFLEKENGEVGVSGKTGDILQRGALHACSLKRGDYRITLLGELPGPALRRIATNLAQPSKGGE
ncbi:MAG TPA: MucB/RseB C-terminal domain-containing protein, partial [Gammaproteobacteria bacterium]|nr:MucB/RseB C-terminal domain-containing protein [Gammaproteobacteria bacterium]